MAWTIGGIEMRTKLLKVVGIVAAIYITFVVLFEAVFLGYYQPKLESSGIPMLVLTTTGETGESSPRRLARIEVDGKVYVSAHHWPRGWYQEALKNPQVKLEIDGVTADHIAVPVEGTEFQDVATQFPLPFIVRFLMGFPPERDVLRLDPVTSTDRGAEA
jgi:hypothetical protein